MLGKIAKFVVKTGIQVGVGFVAAKYLLDLGYEFGQAMQMAQLSLVHSKEPQYVNNILTYYKFTYDTAETIRDVLDKAIEFASDPDEIDNFKRSSKWDRVARYISRFYAFYEMDDPKVKFNEVILPHQDYLYRYSQLNPNMECMVLKLRAPSDFGYDFSFDDRIMFQIAFNHNVLYNRTKLSFVGPVENIQNMGQNFWTDYNLIAMDQGLPCIDMDHYTADKFAAN